MSSSRGDSGYMSQFGSIYSQKSESSIRDIYDNLNEKDEDDDYVVDYRDSVTYNDHIEDYGINRTSNHKYSDSLYPPLSNSYSTSPISYEYNENELPSPESNKSPNSPNSPNSLNSQQNWKQPHPYNLPPSPRFGPPMNYPRLPPQKNFNDNSQERPIGPPVRDASLQHIKTKNAAGFNRLNTLPGKNIRPNLHTETATTPRLIDNVHYRKEPDQVAGDVFDFSETHDILDSYYDDPDDLGGSNPVPTNAESIEAENRKREAAAKEILTTERTYVDGLRKLVNVYLLPLRENYQKSVNKILSTKPIATSEEILAIFGNIEQLLKLHEQLLKSLEESPTKHISDIFLQTAPYLKMYTIYLKSFPQAIATMERLNKESKEFKRFLQQCQQRPELGGLPFNSFLSLPIQRIPRYKLLTESLLKYTNNSHPDYNNLKKCFDKISVIADEVNEKIRDAENQQKVLEIQGKVTGLPNNIVDPARRFIHNGNLYKVTPSKIKPHFYEATQDVRAHFLFNDLLLFCLDFQGIYHYKGEIDLRFATVINIKDESANMPHCFQIITKNGAHTVRAKSHVEKTKWITRLNETIWSLQNGSNSDGKLLIPIRQ